MRHRQLARAAQIYRKRGCALRLKPPGAAEIHRQRGGSADAVVAAAAFIDADREMRRHANVDRQGRLERKTAIWPPALVLRPAQLGGVAAEQLQLRQLLR